MATLSTLRARYDQDGLFWHTLVMMFWVHMGSVANLFFHVVMGWALTKEEYGVLATMLGLIMIGATPMLALQNTLAHFSARLYSEGHAGSIPALVWRWYKKLFPVALVILVAAYFVSGPAQHFFHLDSRLPLILVGLALSGTLFMSLIPGALQGMQKFFWMCLAINTWGFARLILGAALVYTINRSAVQGLSAQAIGAYLTIVTGYFALKHVLKGEPKGGQTIAGVEQYFGKSVLSLGAYAFLMNADIIMVKHFFEDGELVGTFARAATIGRTLIFLSQPVAAAMFPKVVSCGALSKEHRITLVKALVFTFIMIALAALVVSLLPQLALLVLFGEGSPSVEQIAVVRMVTWAMVPLGITLILVNFEMAQHRFKMLLPLFLCAMAYVVGVALWHDTFAQVASVLGVVALVSAGALIALLPWRKKDEA